MKNIAKLYMKFFIYLLLTFLAVMIIIELVFGFLRQWNRHAIFEKAQ